MALSDCEKCWSTPCYCGFDYRRHTKEGRYELASVILGVDINYLKASVVIPDDHPMKGEKAFYEK